MLIEKEKCILLHFKTQIDYEKQIILYMISNGEGWHYLAVIKLSLLLRGVTSKRDGFPLSVSLVDVTKHTHFSPDLVIFNEEIPVGKLNFLCSASCE